MAKVTDLRDLLIRDLAVLYSAEKAIERTLPKMAKEANDPELSKGLERHLDETRQHVSNLEEVFQLLGEEPRATKSAAIEGLTLEHKGFAADAADDVHPEVLDLVALRSATATEHHEISAYESLISLAKGVGETEVVPFLERNLEQERKMLANAEDLARRLGSQNDPDLNDALRSGIDRERDTPLAADEVSGRETLGAATRTRTPGL